MSVQGIKAILSVLAVTMTFICYIPYLVDIIKGKTHPHVYTWLVWSILNVLAFLLQIVGGAGIGSWMTLAATVITVVILIAGLKYGKRDVTKLDTIFLALSCTALVLWLLVKQPIMSIVLVTFTDLLGFLPTIRKSWDRPYTETLFTYELSSVRHLISLLSLEQYNILTYLYPTAWMSATAFFSAMLILRRKVIKNDSGALDSDS